MNDLAINYEIIFSLGKLSYVYPYQPFFIVISVYAIFVYNFYNKDKIIRIKTWLIGLIIIMFFIGLASYFRFIKVNKHMEINEPLVLSGEVTKIYYGSSTSYGYTINNRIIGMSTQSLYCLNKNILNINDMVIVKYYDSNSIGNGDCIVEVKRLQNKNQPLPTK